MLPKCYLFKPELLYKSSALCFKFARFKVSNVKFTLYF